MKERKGGIVITDWRWAAGDGDWIRIKNPKLVESKSWRLKAGILEKKSEDFELREGIGKSGKSDRERVSEFSERFAVPVSISLSKPFLFSLRIAAASFKQKITTNTKLKGKKKKKGKERCLWVFHIWVLYPYYYPMHVLWSSPLSVWFDLMNSVWYCKWGKLICLGII